MNIFFSFVETGELRIEKVFLDMGYPILFTCTDSAGKIYLCVCCLSNENGKKWLMKETKGSVIVKMLRNQITIRQAFLEGDGEQYTILQDENVHLVVNDLQDWDAENSIFLPDAGEYMEAEDGEFDEEIIYYMWKKILSCPLKELSEIASVSVKLDMDGLNSKREETMEYTEPDSRQRKWDFERIDIPIESNSLASYAA